VIRTTPPLQAEPGVRAGRHVDGTTNRLLFSFLSEIQMQVENTKEVMQAEEEFLIRELTEEEVLQVAGGQIHRM
jgi:hypothetical protein